MAVRHSTGGMQLGAAIRWALYDRVIAFGSFLLGALVTAGIAVLGARESVSTFLFEDFSATPPTADLAILGGAVLAGLFVWQVGRTTARHRSMVTATERQVDEHLDRDDIARAAVSKLDDRMGAIESDVEEVRRQAARVEQAMRSGDFDVAELEQGVGEAPSSSPTAGGAGGGGSGAGTDVPAGDGSGTDVDAGATGASGGGSASGGGGGSDGTESQTAGAAGDDEADASGDAPGTATGDKAQDSTGEPPDAGGPADAANGGTGGRGGDDDGQDDPETGDDEFEWGDDGDEEYYRNS